MNVSRFRNLRPDIVIHGDYLLCYPRGMSMRPFIKGGSIVRCRPFGACSSDSPSLGDILLFEINNRLIVHRLMETGTLKSGKDYLVMRGDAQSTSEWISIDQVCGVAEHVLQPDLMAINLKHGFLGGMNKLFGKLLVTIHQLERPRWSDHGHELVKSYSDRKQYQLNSLLHRISFNLLHPPVALLLWLSTKMNRELPRARKNQLQKEKDLLATLVRGDFDASARAKPWQIQLILDHQMAGSVNADIEPHESWTPVFQQRKHQMLKSIQVQLQAKRLFERCNNHNVNFLPLKALSLLADLYADDPSRRAFGDIDLYVSQQDMWVFHEQVMKLGYSLKNQSALDLDRLNSKQKVEYYPPEYGSLPLDVHTAFITKKLIRPSLGFTDIKLLDHRRVVTFEGEPLMLLEGTYEWLYLAQHWVLHHRMSGIKWLQELMLLFERMTGENREILFQTAEKMNFRSIVAAVLQAMKAYCNIETPIPESIRISSAFGRLWTNQALRPAIFLKQRLVTQRNNIFNRALSVLWEVLFIDHQHDRRAALMSMILPTETMLRVFYGFDSKTLAILLYPLHAVTATIVCVVFLCDSALRYFRVRV